MVLVIVCHPYFHGSHLARTCRRNTAGLNREFLAHNIDLYALDLRFGSVYIAAVGHAMGVNSSV